MTLIDFLTMKKLIHVNQHAIRRNAHVEPEHREPVISCKTYKDNQYADGVVILGNDGEEVARVVYRPDKPLSCGAKVWVETKNQVIISRMKNK